MFSEKRCSKCKQVLPLSVFSKDKSKADGLRPDCSDCRRAQRVLVVDAIKTRRKRYYLENREAILERDKAYRLSNLEKNKAYYHQYNLNHKQQRKSYNIAYRAEHKEEILHAKRTYRTKNLEMAKKKDSVYRLAHLEERLRYHREWQKKNPDRIRVYCDKRRAAKMAGGIYTLEEWQALKARCDNRCLCCGKQEPAITLTADHVIPLAKGGKNTIENIQPLCCPCNFKKHTDETDYRTAVPPLLYQRVIEAQLS